MMEFTPKTFKAQRNNMENFGFAVFDNVLSPQDHAFVWTYIQNERMEFVHQDRWVKAFRLTDGCPLWGPPHLSEPYGPGSVILIISMPRKPRSCRVYIRSGKEIFPILSLSSNKRFAKRRQFLHLFND